MTLGSVPFHYCCSFSLEPGGLDRTEGGCSWVRTEIHEFLPRPLEFGHRVGDTQASWGYMASSPQAWLE